MIIEVDPTSSVPPYEQIRSQITVLIEGEVLKSGTKLPPIRQLAGDLGVATNTVQRAYRELESDGLLESRGRHGTVVTATATTRAAAPSLVPAVQKMAADLSRRAKASDMTIDDLLHVVRVEFARSVR